MDKNLFLKTVAEVLKYDDKYCKAEYRDALIKLISRSKENFVPQYEFANHGRSYQHWENIELRTPVPLLNEARVQGKNINDLFEYVYDEDEYYALGDIEIRPPVIDESEEIKEYTVPLHLIMNLSQSLLKSLWNYIMGFIFKRRQIEIFGGAWYGFK